MKFIDLTGKKFGKWTIIEKGPSQKHKATWLVRCECGNESFVGSAELNNGNSIQCRSCGSKNNHARTIDLTGKTFGKWTVLEKSEVKDNRAMWRVRCECGAESSVAGNNLTGGHSTQCRKCGHKAIDLGETSVFNLLYGSYKRAAIKRGLEWRLSEEEFRKLTKGSCNYCGIPPNRVKTKERGTGVYVCNGVDRVDNEHGYYIENCVPCCAMCNRMKWDHSYTDFVTQVYRIFQHLKLDGGEDAR